MLTYGDPDDEVPKNVDICLLLVCLAKLTPLTASS